PLDRRRHADQLPQGPPAQGSQARRRPHAPDRAGHPGQQAGCRRHQAGSGRPEETRPRGRPASMRPLARLAIVLGLALAPRAAPLTTDVLDGGQGDAILTRPPEGKPALIAAGPPRHVVELLKARGIERLDLVVVSHHHADHYGGMAAVIQEFRPRVFLASNSSHTTPRYLALLELVRDQGIPAIQPTNPTRQIELGSVLPNVFPPAPQDRADEDDNS